MTKAVDIRHVYVFLKSTEYFILFLAIVYLLEKNFSTNAKK